MDLLTELKTRTRPHHDRIEAALNPMRPGLTPADYTAMLGRLYGFHAAWEAAAGRHFAGDRRDFFERRRKAHLLDRDLRRLGLGDAELAALPRCDALPGTETFADVLGSVYVLEGATLGGVHIGRHLAATLGVTPADGGAFFASYGDRVGPMWRETQQFLVALGAGIEEAVVAAAAATFDALQHWAAGSDELSPRAVQPV
jgi:heme oxygenase